jgi:hypothetical protein
MFSTACWLATSITRPERVIHRVQAAVFIPRSQADGLSVSPSFAIKTGANPGLCIRPELATMQVIPLLSPEKWKKQASVSRRAALAKGRVLRFPSMRFSRGSRPTGNARNDAVSGGVLRTRSSLTPV